MIRAVVMFGCRIVRVIIVGRAGGLVLWGVVSRVYFEYGKRRANMRKSILMSRKHTES